MFWRPWSNLVRSFQVSLWRSHHLLYVVFFSILVQVINASTLNLFIQHSIKHASRLQQSFFFFFFWSWESNGFHCNGVDDPRPQRSGATFQRAFKVKSRYAKLVYAHLLRTDRNRQSGEVVEKDSHFQKCFFLTLAPSQKRSSVALKGTGEQKSDRFRSNEGHGLRDPPPQRGF